jgi:O-methyltransferase involved in polyketide biosynthesis
MNLPKPAPDPPPLSGLPGTLLFTLRARAEETARPDTLLHDPLAAAWYAQLPLSPAMQAALAEAYSPVFQLSTAIRARLYDEVAARFVAGRKRPLLVELGAGLSTRSARLNAAQARWVMVDLPEAIAARRLVDGEREGQRFLPYSVADVGWVAEVKEGETAVVPHNILFIAEALLFFLTPGDVQALFTLLRQHFPGAAIACDVLTEQFSPAARRRFAAHNIPMQWLPQDTHELTELGLTITAETVITHHFPARWQELGFDPAHLQTTRGNVLVEAIVGS